MTTSRSRPTSVQVDDGPRMTCDTAKTTTDPEVVRLAQDNSGALLGRTGTGLAAVGAEQPQVGKISRRQEIFGNRSRAQAG